MAKHARASRARVDVLSEPSSLRLCIRDDGQGFDPAKVPPNHLGLGIMRERAQTIGAPLAIDTRLGEGTSVTVCWTADRARRGTKEQSA